MAFIRIVMLIIEVLAGFLLVGVILIQRARDQGMGLAFGANMGESLFGSRASDVLVKATVILAVVFFLNTMLLARFFASGRAARLQAGRSRPPAAAPVAQQPGAGGVAEELPMMPMTDNIMLPETAPVEELPGTIDTTPITEMPADMMPLDTTALPVPVPAE